MLNPGLNQLFHKSQMTLEITNDGSPTLRVINSQESMHHFDGAASETWFVYGTVLQRALQIILEKKWNVFKAASIGLGLGYIEMAWILLLTGFPAQPSEVTWTFDSFEIADQLRENFLMWCQGVEIDSSSIYDTAFKKLQVVSQIQAVTEGSIKEITAKPCFQFHADLLEYNKDTKWNIICFDAFSKNTDPQFWTENYLDGFLKKHAANDCVFTTYAATSILKKVLIKNDFQLIPRLGFSGKRECTLAVRGNFKDGFGTFQTF